MTDDHKDIMVAALTAGVRTPSSRFRLRQYVERLDEHGVVVEEHIPFFEKSCGLPSVFKAAARVPGIVRSRRADLVWVGKELVKGYATFERWLKRPRVLDVDDAIWLSKPFGGFAARRIAQVMDAVVAGNAYLAEWFGQYCQRVYVVPTAIDVQRYAYRDETAAREGEKFVIGWTGLGSNYKYLQPIAAALAEFLLRHADAELMLVADRPWRQNAIPAERVRFCPWSPTVEATALQEMSVGIMPLPETDWSRGKCSFKMLQYMAVGLPVVVTPVGMNVEVLERGRCGTAARTADEWLDALEQLYQNRALQIDMGRTGRQVVEEHFNSAVVADRLAMIFRELVEG